MSATGNTLREAPIDSFQTRVAEHGRVRAILESFAYIQPFGGMFGKIVPLYAESYWYAMGGPDLPHVRLSHRKRGRALAGWPLLVVDQSGWPVL
jgi:hypothetical protein